VVKFYYEQPAGASGHEIKNFLMTTIIKRVSRNGAHGVVTTHKGSSEIWEAIAGRERSTCLVRGGGGLSDESINLSQRQSLFMIRWVQWSCRNLYGREWVI